MEHTSENRPFRRTEISLRAIPPSSSVRNTSLPTSRNYSPSSLNSGRWKWCKWIVEIGQMIVSIIALALSLNENPKDQFQAWTVCCLVTLLLLYLSCRLGFGIMETFGHLFCFFSFLAWFINMWTENLGRKWMAFLLFSHIKVIAELLIALFQTINNLLYIHPIERLEDETRSKRGASAETVDGLPKYKFKAKKSSEGNGRKDESESSGEDGIMIAVGSKKESPVSAEDATCCICLGKYKDDEDLRELPCRHHFHVECVDKWLNINASCPLCKRKIGESSEAALQSLPLWWSELGRIG